MQDLNNDYEIPTFDYKEFKKEINSGDLNGLDYIEKTIIRDFKDFDVCLIGHTHIYKDANLTFQRGWHLFFKHDEFASSVSICISTLKSSRTRI